MSQKLKLTLTSQALERLIGGDTEIEAELRQGIASEFAKRYLKKSFVDAVVHEMNKFRETVADAARAVIWGEYGASSRGWQNPVKLPDVLVREIRNTVKDAVENEVAVQIVAVMQEACSEERLTRLVDANVNARVKAEVRKRVDEILKAAAGAAKGQA